MSEETPQPAIEEPIIEAPVPHASPDDDEFERERKRQVGFRYKKKPPKRRKYAKPRNPLGIGGKNGGRPPNPDALGPASHAAATINRFEAALTRPRLVETLQHVQDLTPEESIFLDAIADHRRDVTKLDKICREQNFTFGKLIAFFRKAHATQSMAKSFTEIYEKAPATVADVLDRSIPHKRICEDCWGEKRVKIGNDIDPETGAWKTLPCKSCNETGSTEVLPTEKRQEMVLQIVGLLKTGGAQVNVNTQVNNNAAFIARSTSDFRDAIGKILYSKKPLATLAEAPIEAEVISQEIPSGS